MFNNVKAKKRLTQLIVAFIVICMSVTGSFLLLDDAIDSADAATYNLSVNSADSWNSAVNKSSGDTVNITLTGSFDAGKKLDAIPAGVTVNLNMNGNSIIWDTQQENTTNIMDTNYSDGIRTDFWGLITNNGTLNITGTGTIRMKKINYNYTNNSKKDEFATKSAAVVNNGTMTVGSGIVIENYTAMCGTKRSGSGNYMDTFVYGCAIYNASGKITTSGTISAGSMATSVGVSGSNSYAYAFSYGIYGGDVVTKGGKINSVAYSGCMDTSTTCTTGDHIVAIGVGIYSNNAQLLGDTKIDSTTTTWMSNTSNNCWGGSGGIDISVSVGVLYVNTNYPVIGASVDIDSKFFCTAGSDMTLSIPGAPELYYGSLRNADDPRDYARRAYPIAGAAKVQNTIGDHISEMNWQDGDFFGVPSSGSNDVENNFNMNANMFYYPEEAYFGNEKVTTELAVNANSQFQRETNANDWQEAIGSFRNGIPGTAGTQFKVIYRYFDGTFDSNKLIEVSPKADNRLKNKASIAVGGTANGTGAMTNASESVTLVSGSGEPQNSKYYSFAGATYEKVPTESFANRSYTNKANWSDKGSNLSNVTMSTTNTLVVYMNYIKRAPSAVRVVAGNTAIDQYTTGTSFSTVYTGKALVPGEDFKLGIIDMGVEKTPETNNTGDDTVVTNVYDISGEGSGSGNDATAVTYRYSTDNTNWENGLPTDVGTYSIEVNVNADVTYDVSGTYNRQAASQIITGTITKANISITGDAAKTGAYGATYADLIPFSSYTAKGLGSDSIEGSWSYAGLNSNVYPDAGQYTVYLAWTPTAGTRTANNYNATTFAVALNVTKRDVKVNAGASTVTYGDSKPSYVLAFENLADCDNAKRAEWSNTTTYYVYYNDAWVEYSAGIPAGTYRAQIRDFGGASDLNNNFTVNAADGTLTVQKRSIVYNAVATDRAYNGSDVVDVKLSYVSGNYLNDAYDSVINTTGKMPAGANAADGKQVRVDTSLITIKNAENYNLVIYNNDTISVNIAKANPAGVSVVADPATITYDADATLATATTLKVTESAVEGYWSWKDSSINPTVDVATYTAVFTPADAINYNSIEKNVILTVNQKEVKVTVKDFTIAYGDAIPAIQGALTYDGLGSDTIGTIGASGSVDVTTTYTRGSGVGEYPVNVVSTLTATNYYFTAVNNKIVVVPRELKVIALDQTVTYGAAAPELDVTDLRFEGFYGSDNYTTLEGTVEVKTTYVPGAKVDTYPITASGYSSANYAIEFVDGALTVNKAVLTVTPNNVTDVTYGADAPAYAKNGYYRFTGFVAGDTAETVTIEGTPAFTTGYESGKDAGTYPVTVTVNDLKATNYTFVGAEGTLVVGKATPVVAGLPGVTVVNSHKYSTATFDGSEKVVNPNKADIVVEGKFTLQNADAVASYDNQFVDVVAVYTPYNTLNYNSTTVTLPLQVLQKLVSGTPVIQGSAMEGKTLTLNLSAMDPADVSCYTIQWYADGVAIAGAYGTSYEIKTTDIGKKFHVVITADESKGFLGDAATDATSAVIKALLETTKNQFKADIVNVEYDAFSHKVDVSLADGYDAQYFGDITVKYNGVTTAPTNAGKYTVTVDVSAPAEPAGGYDSSKHYGPATGIVIGELEITRAPFTVTVIATDKTYDGTTVAYATMTGSGLKDENDDVRVSPGCQFAFKDANVGTNKEVVVTAMELTGAQADNYYIVPDVSTASITPRVLSARVTAVSKVYDGTRLVNVTFSNVEGYASTDSSSTVYLTNGTANAVSADAGEQNIENVSCTLAGSKAANYVVVYTNASTAKVVISPATPNVVAPTLYGIEYNAGVTLENLNILLTPYATADGFWQFNNLSTVPTVKQKAYSATYVSRNKNYTNTVADVTIHVEPLAVTLVPIDATVTYGSKAPVIKVGPEVLPDGTLLTEIGGSCTAVHSYRAGADIGSYEIRLNNALSDDNYTFTTGTGTLTVVPATINVTASAVNKVYDGTSDITVKFDIVSGRYNNDDVDVNVKSTIGQAATPNAGTTTVTYTTPVLVGTKSENYELKLTPASGALSVIIAKADVAGITFPVDGQVEFGYDLRYATFKIDGVGDGTFAFEDAKNITPPELGYYEYKVIFTPTDARNYNTQEAMISLEVIKCQLNYVVGVAGTTQVGQTLSVVTTGLPAVAADYIQYQWYRSDGTKLTAINGATSDRYVATDADVGYTLIVHTFFDPATPYVYHENANTETFDNGVTYGISGQAKEAIKEITLTFWQRLMDWLYRIIAVLTGIQLGGGLLG